MSDKIDHRNKKLISDPLAMLPAHYAVQSLLDELFVWLERRLDFIANNEPIVWYFSNTTVPRVSLKFNFIKIGKAIEQVDSQR